MVCGNEPIVVVGSGGQVQALGLGGLALEVGLAGAVGLGQGRGAAADLGAHDAGGGGTLLEDTGGLGNLGVDGFPSPRPGRGPE